MPKATQASSFRGLRDIFVEGEVLTRLHLIRERSTDAVRRKKERVLSETGRLACEACGFDFSEVYGPLGEGFAECHHTQPLANLAGERATRLTDLAIVCRKLPPDAAPGETTAHDRGPSASDPANQALTVRKRTRVIYRFPASIDVPSKCRVSAGFGGNSGKDSQNARGEHTHITAASPLPKSTLASIPPVVNSCGSIHFTARTCTSGKRDPFAARQAATDPNSASLQKGSRQPTNGRNGIW